MCSQALTCLPLVADLKEYKGYHVICTSKSGFDVPDRQFTNQQLQSFFSTKSFSLVPSSIGTIKLSYQKLDSKTTCIFLVQFLKQVIELQFSSSSIPILLVLQLQYTIKTLLTMELNHAAAACMHEYQDRHYYHKLQSCI